LDKITARFGGLFQFRSPRFALGDLQARYFFLIRHSDAFRSLAAASGFQPCTSWCDPDGLISIHWLEPVCLAE